MKKLLLIAFLIMGSLTFVRCNNGECVCGWPQPPCDPTLESAYECQECHGYRWTCGGEKKAPAPTSKPKSVSEVLDNKCKCADDHDYIDADGFNWKTGKKEAKK